MNYISRENSVLTGRKNLERLYEFQEFPVFMGCTDKAPSEDIKADMSFSICKDTGVIQLDRLLPLDLVYQSQHNDGIGKIWQDHYLAFSHFLDEFSPKKVLEIGGAHDFIANDFLTRNPNAQWTVIEPHPLFESSERIRVIKGWFDGNFSLDDSVDTVVHSHVFEHTYEPLAFLEYISDFLKTGEKHIFTFPNMVEMLSKKYTNCLNFEHTAFLAEPLVDALLHNNGFRILKKKYFQDHSIFYATEKLEAGSFSRIKIPNKYEEYKRLFEEFIEYHEKLVADLNAKIGAHQGDVFLFGAHIFTQYLLEFGLRVDRVKNVLDNSEIKNRKRLYGTKLIVENPKIISGLDSPAVVLKIGAYRNEVIQQLKEINPRVIIFE